MAKDLTVKSMKWLSDGAEATTAAFGKALTVEIKIDSNDGSSLANLTKEDFVVTPADYAVKSVETVGVDGSSVIVTLEAPEVKELALTGVKLGGLTDLVKTESLAEQTVSVETVTTADKSAVTAEIEGWYSDSTCESPAVDTIDTGDYYVKITLSAADGYTFGSSSFTGTSGVTQPDSTTYRVSSVNTTSDGKTVTAVLTINVA